MSDLANLFLYQETVQTGSSPCYIGKVLVFSGVFGGCPRKGRSSSQSTRQAFPRVGITTVETAFQSTDPPVGYVLTIALLGAAECPLAVPRAGLSPHRRAAFSRCSVSTRDSLQERLPHSLWGRDGYNFYIQSQQDSLWVRTEDFFAMLSGLPSREEEWKGLFERCKMKWLPLFFHLCFTS